MVLAVAWDACTEFAAPIRAGLHISGGEGLGAALQLNPFLEWSHHCLWYQNVKKSFLIDLLNFRSGSHRCCWLNTHLAKEKIQVFGEGDTFENP